MWQEVLERFEKHAPASVMARIALEQAMPAAWIDEVFEANRQRQYPRELLFSTVVELMTLVSLGLQPSLHAAARKMENLPVSLAALYDKVKRTELPLLRALVQGSSARLQPIAAALDGGACVPGWQLRIVDGNHLPGSQKRLAPLRGHRGAALPGPGGVRPRLGAGGRPGGLRGRVRKRTHRRDAPVRQRRAGPDLDRRPPLLHPHDPAALP